MTVMHAIVTGGSSGIGRAFARKLAQKGYDLSLIARGEDKLNEAAAEIRRSCLRPDQKVMIFRANVADAGQAEAAVATAIRALGTPDLVVTSAGIAVPDYFEAIPNEVHERSMAVNYFGSLYVVRAALPSMRARRRGRILLVSSGAGLMGLFGYTSYCPSKFALRGLAEALRAELRGDHVGVSIVYPPDTDTPMLHEEEKTKPEETKLMTAIVKTWSADAVAECMMRGIERGAFGITPGWQLAAMNRTPGLVIPLLHWYCNRLAASVRRKRHPEGDLPTSPKAV
ncbi:MAG TPA: SDR family oxidoreductase [Stellaceae bacterium]|nr:SDR family oxidoreductase [Stellaceae bacterium]